MLAPTGFFSTMGVTSGFWRKPRSYRNADIVSRSVRTTGDVIWRGWTSSAFRAYRGDATTAWGPHGTS